MSRSSFKAHAVDASGAVLTSASVTVRDQSGVVISPSALFTAYSGAGTHASNPFTATGGLISFYVEGSQVVTVSAVSGGTSQTWSNVVLNELIEPSDFATSAQGTKADTALQAADITSKADLVGGVIPNSQLPSLAITEYLGVAANQTALLALSGQRGDWATRTDLGTTFILTSDGGSSIGDWTEIATPADAVSSVNGNTGAIVLDASDVGAATTAQGALADSATQPADLGTAAAADLTTSTTDTTAGRVLKVDDFGLGEVSFPNANVDLDSLLTPTGFYRVTSGSINIASKPVGSSSFGYLTVTRYDQNNIMQAYAEIGQVNSGQKNYFTRTYNTATGAWNDWVELWTTGNLTKGTGATDVPTNADLGTAAQADLTTSATDTTAGRVLKVGDFGLGSGPVTLSDYTTMESVARVFRETPSTVGGSGDDTYGVLAIPVSGTPRTAFFKLSGANKMFVGNKTGSGSSPTFNEVWTTSNYQPETSLGLGVVRKMKNKSGGAIADQAQVAGSSLKAVYTDSSGVEQESPATIGGTWINVSGMSLGNNEAAEFTKL